MILPEPKGRPVWTPLVILLFLAVLILADSKDMLALFEGRMGRTGQARAALEFGVGLMMLWGLVRATMKAATWTPASAESDQTAAD